MMTLSLYQYKFPAGMSITINQLISFCM